jgi:rod shape determining protein RodA
MIPTPPPGFSFSSLWLRLRQAIDPILIGAILPIIGAGLITMNSFSGQSPFFDKQIVWIIISVGIFLGISLIDVRILKRTPIVVGLFIFSIVLLLLLFLLGHISRGAVSWFRLGLFSVEPSDPAQIVLIILLAKYFSRRHIEIANIRHIIVSGAYALAAFVLILVQPDFGVAIIVFCIWLGMVLVSGISKKHLLVVFLVGLAAFAGLWFFGFKEYQRDRIKTFLHPFADIRGAGYNAYQSTVAVGSGEVAGKGVGYGTQSRLNFLPEYQTDFIFAAFAEEWGFIGSILLLLLYGIIIWRVMAAALSGFSNFEVLYGIGLAIFLASHIIINVGMNIGLLPVTGVTLPFMSYGGSHLATEFAALGILMSMRRYRLSVGRDTARNELSGIENSLDF